VAVVAGAEAGSVVAEAAFPVAAGLAVSGAEAAVAEELRAAGKE